ncbi:MAG TPA: hypothetical protein VL500_05940 [Candidatus Eisenbacteria bacterium]|nr:hypothetical protein [Candidatus Eisenbacteria bacterium]
MERMRTVAMRTYPWAAPVLIGTAFAGVSLVAGLAPVAAHLAVPALIAFASLVAAFATYGLARIGHARRIAALTAATPAALVMGAFGCFLIVDTRVARIALAASAVILTAVYLAYVRGMVKRDERFRAEDFSHLSFAVHVTSVFFMLAFVFGAPGYLQVPMPAAAFVVALGILVATAESTRRAGLNGRDSAAITAAFAALGVQLYLALSFLPTTNLVNAAVGTVLYAAGLHAAVSALAGKVPAPAFRRQFALSFALVAIVFATARWA